MATNVMAQVRGSRIGSCISGFIVIILVFLKQTLQLQLGRLGATMYRGCVGKGANAMQPRVVMGSYSIDCEVS
jgi:hypothetical protein